MKRRDFVRWSVRAAGGLVSVPLLQACGGGSKGDTVVPPLAIRNAYRRVDLVASKASYGAPFTIPGFVNAWGIAIRPAGAGGHFWIGAGGASYEFVGDVSASADPALRTLFQDALAEVGVPGADALSTSGSVGKTTGVAFNGAPINSNLFRVTTQSAVVDGVSVTFNGSARFIFVTDSGKLSAWTDRTASGTTVRRNGPAQWVYDGTPLGMSLFGVAVNTATWDTLWAADFGTTPQIRQFDGAWNLVPTQGFANPFATGDLLAAANPSQGNAARPGEPVPFNIQVIGSRVFVMYCISQVLRDASGFIIDASKTLPSEEDSLDADAEDRADGMPDRGKVVEYTLSGVPVRVYDDAGRLNAPWGVALAPAHFGLLSNALLIGNFGGAGKIAAFNQTTGRFIDYLRDESGNVIGLDGTWGLVFGNGVSLGDSSALYFAAGTEGEAAGVLGSLRYAD